MVDEISKKHIYWNHFKSIDTVRLGKEYMDKYLEVSLYLEEG